MKTKKFIGVKHSVYVESFESKEEAIANNYKMVLMVGEMGNDEVKMFKRLFQSDLYKEVGGYLIHLIEKMNKGKKA